MFICLQVIAESLSEEEIAGLREMFKAMDTDNSGAITFDELKAGLRKYGSTLKDTEIRDLMDAVSNFTDLLLRSCSFLDQLVEDFNLYSILLSFNSSGASFRNLIMVKLRNQSYFLVG